MARRRKLTDPRTEMLLNALRLGNTRRAASLFAGIHVATFYRMLERDATFREAVEKAEADAEFTYASRVAVASDDPRTWQAAAWWLERRRPDDYGRRDRVEVTVDVRAIIQKIAADRGLDESEVMAEAERILAENR